MGFELANRGEEEEIQVQRTLNFASHDSVVRATLFPGSSPHPDLECSSVCQSSNRQPPHRFCSGLNYTNIHSMNKVLA